MEDEHFMQAVAQTVDALTFAQTHVVDCDFRAHSKSTADSVASLQSEQRSRVENTFGAIGASPEYLASILVAMYRGEAAAVTAAKELGQGDCALLEKMPDGIAKAFKKEMKQRIHEWEGAFRERYQQEAAPNDKITLRPIYELYKYAKARVLRLEQREGNGAAGAPMPPAGDGLSQRTQRPGAVAAPAASTTSTTPNRRSEQPYDARFASNPVVARQLPLQPTTPPSTFTPTAAVRMAGAAVANTTPPPSHHHGLEVAAGPSAPIAGLNMEELANEKRRLKRILHQFESEFETRYGRKPTKDDRKDFAKEYNRYGELKSLLNESTKAGDN
jgi:hypothetical protein